MINIAFIREVGPVRWFVRTAIRQFYKRILRVEQKMRLPTGEWITLPVSNRFSSEAFITGGDVDWGSERLLETMLTKHGVFLDVGAHIGYYSLYFFPQVSAVYSFEPDSRVRMFLEKNVATKRKIEVVPSAVGAAPGKASFTQAHDAATSHLTSEGERGDGQITVDVITLDQFVADRKLAVEAIKIDAEGHDIEVLMGAMKVLAELRPIVLTEAHPDATLFDLTESVGYRSFAYSRPPLPAAKYFGELSRDKPFDRTKMLFLVPAERAEELLRNAVGLQ